jgi:dolichol-phosphate mannosyltransferase
VPENVSDFRLIDKKVYETVNNMNEQNKFLRGIIAWTGFRQIGIPFTRPPRFAGRSKASFAEVYRVASNGIFSFSYFPLQIASYLGFFLSLVSLVLAIFELYLFIKLGRIVHGFTTIIVAILFLFGMLFFLLGVIGEYIARIYDETKQRPNFIISEKVGSFYK